MKSENAELSDTDSSAFFIGKRRPIHQVKSMV